MVAPRKNYYKAARFVKGYQYQVVSGDLKGEVVTMVDNTPFPDDHPERRKVTVSFNGEIGYMLPRQLGDEPVVTVPLAVTAVAPADDESPVPADVITIPSSVATLQRVETAQAAAAAEAFDIEQMTQLMESVKIRPFDGPMDPRLDHLRPRRELADRYISRRMKNGRTDIEVLLEYANDVNRAGNEGYPVPFALKGETQSGKTMLVQVLAIKWAELMGYPKPMPIFTLSGSAGVTDYQMFGQPAPMIINGIDRVVWLAGVVAMAAEAGGILYIDEINAILERYTTSLYSLTDYRHEFTNTGKAVLVEGLPMPEHVRAHEHFWPIATYNEGYEGMVKLNKAIHQRFDHILWDYDETVERTLLEKSGPADGLLNIAKAMRTARKNHKIGTAVGTLALKRFQRNIGIHGVEQAVEIFYGMFDARDRGVAEEIMNNSTNGLLNALHEEERQRRLDSGIDTISPDDAAKRLAGMLDTEPF